MRLLLDENWTWDDLLSEEKTIIQRVSESKCSCGKMCPWNAPSPPFVANLKRFNVERLPNLVGDEGFLKRNFNVFVFVAHDNERRDLLQEWRRRKLVSRGFCQCKLRSYFKAVTGLFKLGAEWRSCNNPSNLEK